MRTYQWLLTSVRVYILRVMMHTLRVRRRGWSNIETPHGQRRILWERDLFQWVHTLQCWLRLWCFQNTAKQSFAWKGTWTWLFFFFTILRRVTTVNTCAKFLLVLMRFDAVLQVFQPTGLILGHPLEAGFDSHMSPCKKELVMFHSERILPCYIVHYSITGGEFKYKVSH